MSEATRAVAEFLRHVLEHDLGDVELFEMKARTFDLMAAEEDHEPTAQECRERAAEARAVAERYRDGGEESHD